MGKEQNSQQSGGQQTQQQQPQQPATNQPSRPTFQGTEIRGNVHGERK